MSESLVALKAVTTELELGVIQYELRMADLAAEIGSLLCDIDHAVNVYL